MDSIQPIEEYLLTNLAFPSSLSKCNASMIKNPIIHSDHINDIPSIFVADPFIILKEGTNELYIFFESLDYAFRGFIGVLVSMIMDLLGNTWCDTGGKLPFIVSICIL